MLRHLRILSSIGLLLTILNCGKTAPLAGTGKISSELAPNELTPYAQEIDGLYQAPPTTSLPVTSPTPGLQGQLQQLKQNFLGAQSGGKGQRLQKLMGAFCQLQSMHQQVQPQNQMYGAIGLGGGIGFGGPGIGRWGNVLTRMKARTGALIQAGTGQQGGSYSQYPTLPAMRPQFGAKLQQICANPAAMSAMQGMTFSQYGQAQSMDATQDLGDATNSIYNQIYGF